MSTLYMALMSMTWTALRILSVAQGASEKKSWFVGSLCLCAPSKVFGAAPIQSSGLLRGGPGGQDAPNFCACHRQVDARGPAAIQELQWLRHLQVRPRPRAGVKLGAPEIKPPCDICQNYSGMRGSWNSPEQLQVHIHTPTRRAETVGAT